MDYAFGEGGKPEVLKGPGEAHPHPQEGFEGKREER